MLAALRTFLILVVCFVGTTLVAVADDSAPPVDTITLKKHSKVIKGRIVLVDDEKIVLRVKSKHKEYAREDVDTYLWSEEKHLELLPRLVKGLTSGSASDMRSLAEEFTSASLFGEANLAYWLALAKDPTDAVSHKALGHSKKGKRWRVRIDGKWIFWEQLAKKTADWGSCWTISSSHFDLRTNLPLDEALLCLLQSESVFRQFYDHYGPELGLMTPTRSSELHVHADQKSFPGSTRIQSEYSGSDNRITLDAHTGYRTSDMLLSLTEQFLAEASFEAGTRSALPAWVFLGLSRNFSAALNLHVQGSATIDWDPSRVYETDRALHLNAKKPLGLKRVLNMSVSDTYSKSGDLAYAQAGTLVDFCLRGQDGKWRPGFRTFVLGAQVGKGSATHFKKALGYKEKDFEAAWGRYAGRE